MGGMPGDCLFASSEGQRRRLLARFNRIGIEGRVQSNADAETRNALRTPKACHGDPVERDNADLPAKGRACRQPMGGKSRIKCFCYDLARFGAIWLD